MSKASDVVRIALAGLEAGEYEVITDDLTASVKQGLSGPISARYLSSPSPRSSSAAELALRQASTIGARAE